ncbi:MAG: bifunctional acetaldehyde-CoA/alcohol dehydrogenase [Anaerolineae bacterium]|nr:bifunctional acetaldehyde-CoA/alcohol dehydrogenase [Anaerolineae bacterium]
MTQLTDSTLTVTSAVPAYPVTESPQSLERLIDRVSTAQARFASYTQQQVDLIFRQASLAANNARIALARMAVVETGMGILEDKVIKNHFAAEFIYNKYRDEKTCGVISRDDSFGIVKIAEPIGVLAGIIPTTNPTSTTIFKALLALKTRNAIIFAPHPRARKCTIAAARIILEAAVAAGAPDDIIGWIDEPSLELSNQLFTHDKISMILATGGPGMVKAAYSSGKPAIGVGPGNTPAFIDETADLRMAIHSIILSKTFDNGVVCASEQVAIVHNEVYVEVRKLFLENGAYILNGKEKKLVDEFIIDAKRGTVNPAIVGQSAAAIAEMAGLQVPPATKILIAECPKLDYADPFTHEKLSPLLGLIRVKNFEEGLEAARYIVQKGGYGHTSLLFTNKLNHERIQRFGELIETGRVLVNMPASQGAIGDIYNFMLEPSLTLGCGSWGGNSVSENVGVKHLLNIKTIAERRENMLWFRVPPRIYHKYGCLPIALQELNNKKRAFVVTDQILFDMGFYDRVRDILEPMGLDVECFHNVTPDPTLSTIEEGLEMMLRFQPDVLIGLGGGSPMDAAKIMWLLYGNPEMKFDGMAMRFLDIRKRIYNFPEGGNKAIFVAIPTTSGTGSEVTPFSVVTDDRTGIKYPIADYTLTPDMAIIDTELVMNMPKSLTAASGIDAVTHAIEAMVSVLATDYTNGIALESLRILFKYLPIAYREGSKDVRAREKVHNAASMAGMAFANAFLGICHSMAHKLGAEFNIPHGVANALLINTVIEYNSEDVPTKQTAFPQYEYPSAKSRYARIGDYLGLGGSTTCEKMSRLVEAINELKRQLEIPSSIREYGVSEVDFLAVVDGLAERAFDDQCTGANPRYPLISEIRDLYLKAYYGK